MQAIDTLTVQTDMGTLNLAYETYEDTGDKVWAWRDVNGGVVATQPNVTAMAAWKRQHEAR